MKFQITSTKAKLILSLAISISSLFGLKAESPKKEAMQAVESADKQPYVGAWRGHFSNSNRVGMGSCVLIAPQWVMTAAHVAKPLSEGAEDRVIRVTFPGKISRVAVTAVVHRRADIALAKLDNPVTGIEPVTLVSTILVRETHGLVPLIIGGTSGERKSLIGHKAYGNPPMMIRVPNEDLPKGKGGDSGGAWVLETDQSEDHLLIGILSGGMRIKGEMHGRAFQPACFREWIDAHLKEDGSHVIWKDLPAGVSD